MQKSKINLIGLASNATGGKDTLYLILEKILKEYNITTERFALADILKIEVSDFIKNNYGISVFTKNLQEKTLIRGILVEHGRIKRKQSNGRYFINLIDDKIRECINNKCLPIVTDIRYTEYNTDEFNWIKSNNGVLVYIERISPDGQIIPPANKDEEINNIKLKQMADYHLKWPTTDDLNIREDCTKIQLKDLINKITND